MVVRLWCRTMAARIPARILRSCSSWPGSLCPRVVAQDAPAADDPGQDQDVQVLTRGPVHEAFAVPVVHDPKPGLTVAKQPPAPVEESASRPEARGAERPVDLRATGAGTPAATISSGSAAVWREPPPGRQWVPGYWNQVEGGYQWVAGAWVPVDQAASGPGPGRVPDSAGLPPRAAGEPRGRAEQPRPGGQRLLVAGKLVLARHTVRLAPRLLGGRPAELGLDSRPLRLDAGGIPCSSRATGTCRWPAAASSSPRSITPSRSISSRPMSITPAITIASSGLVANLFVQPGYNHYCFRRLLRSILPERRHLSLVFIHVCLGARGPVYYDPLFTFYAAT